MLNTKNIIAAMVLLFSASSAFAALVCDGSVASNSSSVTGYLNGPGEAFSYKAEGLGGIPSCDPAAGCDGYVGFPVYKCNNFTTVLTWAYVKTGPAYDNALVNLIYAMKGNVKKQKIYTLPTPLWSGLQMIGAAPQ